MIKKGFLLTEILVYLLLGTLLLTTFTGALSSLLISLSHYEQERKRALACAFALSRVVGDIKKVARLCHSVREVHPHSISLFDGTGEREWFVRKNKLVLRSKQATVSIADFVSDFSVTPLYAHNKKITAIKVSLTLQTCTQEALVLL